MPPTPLEGPPRPGGLGEDLAAIGGLAAELLHRALGLHERHVVRLRRTFRKKTTDLEKTFRAKSPFAEENKTSRSASNCCGSRSAAFEGVSFSEVTV